jgi:hypothetical protein
VSVERLEQLLGLVLDFWRRPLQPFVLGPDGLELPGKLPADELTVFEHGFPVAQHPPLTASEDVP